MAARFSDPGQPYEGLALRVWKMAGLSQPRWTGKVRFVTERLADPLRWKKPRRIFVNSMSDLFHENLTNEQIAAVFGVMAAAPQHTFQVLTKRAKRMREWFEWAGGDGDTRATRRIGDAAQNAGARVYDRTGPAYVDGNVNQARSPWNNSLCKWPLPNAWIGVSVENQEAADERIPELLQTPAAIRFLSCEPLIGPVNLIGIAGAFRKATSVVGALTNTGWHQTGLAWIVVGCESGPGARPCNADWLRSLRDQCAAAGVAYFLKQAVEEGRDEEWECSVTAQAGSKHKAGGVIELPYLDGVQHANFPEVSS